MSGGVPMATDRMPEIPYMEMAMGMWCCGYCMAGVYNQEMHTAYHQNEWDALVNIRKSFEQHASGIEKLIDLLVQSKILKRGRNT